MLIVSDLDRTLLPNGDEPDEGLLLQCITLIQNAGHTLVYSTGRSLQKFEQAQKTYALPLPDYLFADVGTTLYRNENDTLIHDTAWSNYIQKQTPTWDWEAITQTVRSNAIVLELQEPCNQNDYKVSYYHDITKESGKELTALLQHALHDYNVQVIYSIDHLAHIGFVDILPSCATKATALTYMKERLSLSDNDIIFSGDSGNDILALTAGYKAILVANATEAVKQEVLSISKEKGITGNIFIARHTKALNGNYSSGVLQGLVHHGALTERDVYTVAH